MEARYKYFIVIILFGVSSIDASVRVHEKRNSTELIRNRRFLIYPVNGGTLKIVIGFLFPVIPPSTNRSLNCAFNLQAQYGLPDKIYTFASKFGLHKRRRSVFRQSSDASRELFYQLIESMLDRRGLNGRKCIQRTICEVVSMPLKHNGLIGELLDTAFIPGEEDLHNDYTTAKHVGMVGADCASVYSECSKGILDSVLLEH